MTILCTGVILAGGKSSRMGQDKAELPHGNGTLLDFCQDLLGQVGISDIRISRNVGAGIRDVIEDRGPLAGIYSVLKNKTLGAVLILPIDMPLLQADDLHELIAHGQLTQRPVCYDDCYLPLYLPVNHHVIDYLADQLFNDGDRKVKALLKHFEGERLPQQDRPTLVNTNTPQQWQQTQSYIASRGFHGT